MSTFVGQEHTLQYGPAVLCFIFLLGVYWLRGRGSTMRYISGPASPSWVFGHMQQLLLSPTYGDYEFKWLKMYGPVYKLFGCFGEHRLMVSDPASLQYILNSPHFRFRPNLRSLVDLLYGKKSIMGVDEHAHSRLRAALNVGFTAAAVRDYIPVFEQVAQSLTEELEESGTSCTNICPILNRATISTISQVVLGYSTEDLGQEYMANKFQIMALASSQSPSQVLADAIAARLPAWVLTAAIYLPTRAFKAVRTAKYLAYRVGSQVIREKKDAAQQGMETDTDLYGQLPNSVELHGAGRTKNSLTEDEIIAQTAILTLAGQDTTATTLSFGLLELAKAPQYQEKLRTEILAALAAPHAGGVAYDSVPLLNAFIKEICRLYPVEPMTDRVALQDTIIPLSESIIISTGEHISQIPISKGQLILLGIVSYHRLESRWGKDALEFNPGRWLDGTASKGEAVGPYANLSVNLIDPVLSKRLMYSQFDFPGWPTDLSRMAFRGAGDASVSLRVATKVFVLPLFFIPEPIGYKKYARDPASDK
ncbi:cytochrome P450 [Mycena polygramma]|nr:cytochrome P450 [Mycena polygramma]